LVVLASQRITKTGKPFGTFIFEDYDDSCEIALFGDDFLKFKQFLTEGYFLQIRGRVGERFKKEGDWEFKVTAIDLLSELRDKLTKCITIQVPIEEVNEDLMEKINVILQENKENSERHNCKLNFEVFDREENLKLELPSKSLKINPNNQFLEQLTKLNVVNYKLN
jgi:DNA polymerase-3 subunit alpha